jgi:hypothetical protein
MKKLNTFEEFAKANAKVAAAAVKEEQDAKRSNEAETFKSLLSEYGVAAIKELTEEQRTEFFEKLRGAKVNESIALIEEGTRYQFGKIDKKGNISSVYMHYDGYPENVLPILKKGYKGGKNVDVVIKGGDASGLEVDPKTISYYNDGGSPMTGSFTSDTDIEKYLRTASDEGGAEYVYLWDEANKQWLMADVYAGTGLEPAFESLTISVNEAIQVQYKRDAKKVLTQYNRIFNKILIDFGAMDKSSLLGCIKYLAYAALQDANFHREAEATRFIKGNIQALEIKMPGLGGHFVKIGSVTIKNILDKYYSDIANAAGWSGIGIVEGTALYLEELKEEVMGQAMIDEFNKSFEGEAVRRTSSKNNKVNEAEIKSDDEFKEYAFNVLKKAFGADFDEAKAGEVVNGILKKCDGDYGACVGMLTSSLGESVTNEAIDTKYWADYNTDTSGQGNKEFAEKSKDFEDTFSLAVAEWNDEADGAENRIIGSQVDKVKKIAQQFFKKEGYISVNIAQAMIAQES